MRLGRYSNPKEIIDADVYFKFFTKTDLLLLIGPVLFSFFAVRFGISSGSKFVLFVSLVFTFLVLGVSLLCIKLKVPERLYLFSCGDPVYIVLLRVLVKRTGKQYIYIKDYEEREIS